LSVFGHVAQRRHLHREHRQPVVEIDAEAAGLGLAAEVAVGRGDDARPRHPGLRLADALVLAVFQHAQQLRLELERQFADLVEEQRALGSVLEVAGLARRGRAGERALRVAEQRGFDERRRDRGAVQGEIGACCAGAVAVEQRGRRVPCRCRIRLRSGPERGFRILPELGTQFLHRQAFADQDWALVVRRGQDGGLESADALEYFAQIHRVAGFADKISSAECAGMARIGIVVLA
jgi:hypothetical protein